MAVKNKMWNSNKGFSLTFEIHEGKNQSIYHY